MAAGAAAAGDPLQKLSDEVSCSICLNYFKNPVTIVECGHNFCQDCLSHHCTKRRRRAGCPQCRKPFQEENLLPNRLLASVVEIARKLEEGKGRQGKRGVCEKHQEPLKLFCKEDEVPICVVCDKAQEHRGHEAIPLEEASREYKEKIESYLTSLKKLQEEMCTRKAEINKESQDLLKQTKADKEKTALEFRRFLDKQEKLLLAEMGIVEKEIVKKRDEHMAKLSEEISHLENIIQKLEKKCLQPASEFLQDIKGTLQRNKEKETFEKPVAFPAELKWKIWHIFDMNSFLVAVMKQFQGSTTQPDPLSDGPLIQYPSEEQGIPIEWESLLRKNHHVIDDLLHGIKLQKANVTLDPDTAHPWLILSEDGKSVRYGAKPQGLPDNPERFSEYTYVLGREGFTTGRHFWEVVVGAEEQWSVGVARKSVRRKGKINLLSEEGIWVVGKWGGGYGATYHPSRSVLSLSEKTKRIGVYLNYAAGRVAFCDADTGDQICTLSELPFSQEIVLPFFYMYGKGHLEISP